MSSDAVALRSLSDVCEEELQMFDQARVRFDEDIQHSCYVCIGRHNLCFVMKELDKMVEGCGKLSYMQISRAVLDQSTNCYFMLELDIDPVAALGDIGGDLWQGDDRVLIESHCRDRLLERLGLCWQAEYMFTTYQVKRFPQAKAQFGELISDFAEMQKGKTETLPILPFKGYEDGFACRGYQMFLRSGFKPTAGLSSGSWHHDDGWEVDCAGMLVSVPPGCELNLHVSEPMSSAEIAKAISAQSDLRTVAAAYRQALLEELDQFYVISNNAYLKRMNRAGDIASWDGWEFCIRAKENVFVCVLFRREYIPPLCNTSQDVAVLLRCPADAKMDQYTVEALIEECRFIADSLMPCGGCKKYDEKMVLARLNSLQCYEEDYRWFEGQLGLTPVHKKKAAAKFVKSIIKLLDAEGAIIDDTLLSSEIFREVPVLQNPLDVPEELLSDAEPFLGTENKKERAHRRNAWLGRIARYLAFCVDGGLLGERFTLSTFVQMIYRGNESVRVLRATVEFLLHATQRGNLESLSSDSRITIAQLMQEPEDIGKYTFNRHVMRVLLSENYLASEWRRKGRHGSKSSYETLLAFFLTSPDIGIPLKSLICRQILEDTSKYQGDDDKLTEILVPALLAVMQSDNISLASCATAALVNLSAGKDSTKTLLVTQNILRICMKQLKSKDDDMTLYTLYLLVNLTKAAHFRSIVVSNGGVPILVDILTSSYQNSRKMKILTEVASVIGQLANDATTRTSICNDYPVVVCLMWLYGRAEPNTKCKGKLLFALRQLCVGEMKIKIGRQCIPEIIEQVSSGTPKALDCMVNAILLLTMLAGINWNAREMSRGNRLDVALEQCGLQLREKEAPNHRFGSLMWEKVSILKKKVSDAEILGDM